MSNTSASPARHTILKFINTMRSIPDDNLAYPVMIVINTGSSGSGFLLNTGTSMFVVTAKHVLFDDKANVRGNSVTLTCQSRDINDNSTTIIGINIAVLQASGNIFNHATKDVAAMKIANLVPQLDGYYNTITLEGVTVTQQGNSQIVTVSAQKSVLRIEEVLISNDIFLYGYPSSLGLRQSPQFDYTKPLLRKGIVANVYKPFGTIILDCPVYYGNSGGPVVQVSRQGLNYKHNVIGVVSQFIPYSENWKNQSNGLIHTEISNSGYSVAVAMDYVFEMIGFIPANMAAVD